MTPAEKRAFIQGSQYGSTGKSLPAKELKEINKNPLNKGKGKVGDAFGRGISSGRQERAAAQRGGTMPVKKAAKKINKLIPNRVNKAEQRTRAAAVKKRAPIIAEYKKSRTKKK